MAHFPVFIEITNKRCVVVGGGKVALRKVETLLRYKAAVEVVAEKICEEIAVLLPQECLHQRAFQNTDLSGAVLVIAATASREINHQVAAWCERNHVLVNVADAPEECTFLFPAVVKKGEISIGINTGGTSPSVSGRIRKEIDEAVPEYYGDIARQMGALRQQVKERFPQEKDRRRILKEAAGRAFASGRVLTEEELEQILRSESAEHKKE